MNADFQIHPIRMRMRDVSGWMFTRAIAWRVEVGESFSQIDCNGAFRRLGRASEEGVDHRGNARKTDMEHEV